jgi:hypothetical protein
LQHFIADERWAVLWILALTALGILGANWAVNSPGLRFAQVPTYQFFTSDHPMERYDGQYSRQFGIGKADDSGNLEIDIWWGLGAVDNGNHLDPADRGSTEWQELRVSSRPAQQWMVELCDSMAQQPFVKTAWDGESSSDGSSSNNGGTDNSDAHQCIARDIKRLGMGIPCREAEDRARVVAGGESGMLYRKVGCCGLDSFPFEPQVFRHCMMAWIQTKTHHGNGTLPKKQSMTSSLGTFVKVAAAPFAVALHGGEGELPHLDRTADEGAMLMGHYFDWKAIEPRLLRFKFVSTVPSTDNYDLVDAFYKEVDGWVALQLQSAPAGTGLREGFFLGHSGRMAFYELRSALAQGVYSAMALSLGLAFVVLLLSNGNLAVTLAALVCMACVLALTVGSLIRTGWVLGVTESVVISVAVGMAVDFTVHYGHAYMHAGSSHSKMTRKGRVVTALTKMGPTISMGALTTLVAGCVLMLSGVLFYHQFGVFLALCMFLSWGFSTFYFLSILTLVGPEADTADSNTACKRVTAIAAAVLSAPRWALSCCTNPRSRSSRAAGVGVVGNTAGERSTTVI